LVAFAAEETGYHTVLRGSDVLLHFHRYEDEQRSAGFDMLTGLHEDADDLPSHGSVQVTSASRDRSSMLAGVKEAIFSPLKLEHNLASFFVECRRMVQESLGQLKDALSYCDPVDPGALWHWHNVHFHNLVVCGAVPVRKFHACPPIRQAS
jgi:hypothetical protein